MYKCSAAFHAAVRAGNQQKALLIFNDAVFTDEDIDIENGGIEFDDNFNMEDNLAIGQCTSNEIRFSLFNDDRLLNDYEFGEFTATIGVLIGEDTYAQKGVCMVTTSRARYVGSAEEPYLTRGGVAMAEQPAFPVRAMLGYSGKLWVFSGDGEWAVYDDTTGADITDDNELNDFMKAKSAGWLGKGIFYNPDTRYLAIFEGGTRSRYEFVPLGVFEGERPNVPDQIRVDLQSYDRMTKFDVDMPSASELGVSYPTTLKNLRDKMCDYVGVPYRTDSFINQGASVNDPTERNNSLTMRTVIGWIAEAAGSNARFDRDGFLKMDWIRETEQSYNENDYNAFGPYWYQTPQITKLCNRTTSSGAQTVVGSGKSAYLIQDNPFLAGAS